MLAIKMCVCVRLCVHVRTCVCVCECLADFLCSLSDSQQYPAADTLSGQADWLTGVSVCMCVCVCVFLCVNRRELALPAANQCPLKGMWNLRQRTRAWERKKDSESKRASPGQTHFALFPLSNHSLFTQTLHIFQQNLPEIFLQEEISEDVELPQWEINPRQQLLVVRLRNSIKQPAPVFPKSKWIKDFFTQLWDQKEEDLKVCFYLNGVIFPLYLSVTNFSSISLIPF